MMSAKMKSFYEELKTKYYPALGDIFFFDLSGDQYVVTKFEDEDQFASLGLISKFGRERKAWAIISYLAEDPSPTLFLDGVSFELEECLETGKVLSFRERKPLDMAKVKEELKLLIELLNSEAS